MKKRKIFDTVRLGLLVLILGVLFAGSPAWSAGNLEQCKKKCKKPTSSTIDYSTEATWRKGVTAELAYDTCILRCEKEQFPSGGVWFNTGFKYPSMAGY